MDKKLIDQLEAALFLCVMALVAVGFVTTIMHV